MSKALLIIIIITTIPFYSIGQVEICVDKFYKVESKIGENGSYQSSSQWKPGYNIKCNFIGGTDFIRKKVIKYSKEWEAYANLHFDFIKTSSPDILISFALDNTSWSFIGTSSRNKTKFGLPSMNFGWFDSSTSEETFRRTILHEFGHALGLLHEHKNPYGHIKWNKPAVYNFYISKGWSIHDIEQQILTTYNLDLTNHEYDPYSIMHYHIDSKFTLDGYEVAWNTYLSQGDKELVLDMYPPNDQFANKVNNPTKVWTTPGIGSIFWYSSSNYKIPLNWKTSGIEPSYEIINSKNKPFTFTISFYKADGTPIRKNGEIVTLKDTIIPTDKIYSSEGTYDFPDMPLWDINQGLNRLKLVIELRDYQNNLIGRSGGQYFYFYK